MKKIELINHIQTATVLIDKDMQVIDANKSFTKRGSFDTSSVIGKKCFNTAYKFNECCGSCPAEKTFKTKKTSSAIHHYWINNHAVVEEITSTPVLDKNGNVEYVIEEFHDITKLLGLKKGIISVCSYCRKIRNKKGEWLSFEDYLLEHTGIKCSHGICEDCKSTLFDNVKL